MNQFDNIVIPSGVRISPHVLPKLASLIATRKYNFICIAASSLSEPFLQNNLRRVLEYNCIDTGGAGFCYGALHRKWRDEDFPAPYDSIPLDIALDDFSRYHRVQFLEALYYKMGGT